VRACLLVPDTAATPFATPELDMTARPPIPELILEERLIAVGRRVAAADVPRVSGAIAAGGVHAIELTTDEPHDAAPRLDRVAGAGGR
jgi:hypothetical protein